MAVTASSISSSATQKALPTASNNWLTEARTFGLIESRLNNTVQPAPAMIGVLGIVLITGQRLEIALASYQPRLRPCIADGGAHAAISRKQNVHCHHSFDCVKAPQPWLACRLMVCAQM